MRFLGHKTSNNPKLFDMPLESITVLLITPEKNNVAIRYRQIFLPNSKQVV